MQFAKSLIGLIGLILTDSEPTKAAERPVEISQISFHQCLNHSLKSVIWTKIIINHPQISSVSLFVANS